MTLSEILVAANVPPQQVDQLMNDGWTSEHFALCATSMDEFDGVMAEIFDSALTPLQRAALRLAWTRCQPSPGPTTAETPTTSGYQDVNANSTSWSETFAPKLTSALVSELKVRFKRNYPAEVLHPENLPSLRLLSMVAHQKQKLDYKWIPWKYRLTESKCDEITVSRPNKVARAEGLQLHAILMDEPPAIEIANGNMGMHALRQMFETFSFAMAMTEIAHLSSLKGYYLKFLNMMTQKFDADTGLRGPTILEAQAADKALMNTVIELVVERTWSWDDALYEVTHIRADMTSLLQPRPRLPKSAPQVRHEPSAGKGSSQSSRPAPYSKGAGKRGKSKSKNTRVQWLTETLIKGEKKQWCMRFQPGKCTLGDGCKFHHGCAYPVGDGAEERSQRRAAAIRHVLESIRIAPPLPGQTGQTGQRAETPTADFEAALVDSESGGVRSSQESTTLEDLLPRVAPQAVTGPENSQEMLEAWKTRCESLEKASLYCIGTGFLMVLDSNNATQFVCL
eukprot:s1703_g13.t1